MIDQQKDEEATKMMQANGFIPLDGIRLPVRRKPLDPLTQNMSKDQRIQKLERENQIMRTWIIPLLVVLIIGVVLGLCMFARAFPPI